MLHEDYRSALHARITAHEARVAVIGQGYVGLPLAVEFARAGLPVIGFDRDLDRVGALNLG
jgi:UDP-N-acetyl-D-mannosaminuronate dehydrogenase